MHPAGASAETTMSEVTVVIGAGSIGQAIARRVSAGKHVLLADLHQGNAEVAAEVLRNAGFEVSTATVDVSSRESLHALVETATGLGEIPRNKPPRPRHRESVRATRERDRQAAPIERGRAGEDALILRRPRGVLIRGLDAATAPARGS
jgi:threonine dehydrogenase-like Zn-dependent dehydrogenase